MKIKFLFFLSAIIIRLHAQDFDSLCLQQRMVAGNFKAFHFDPPEFNATTCTQILELFSDEADPRNLFIFKSDKEKLMQLASNYYGEDIFCKAIPLSYDFMSRHAKQADSILKIIETGNLIFSEKDTIRFLAKDAKRVLLNDTKEMRKRMEKQIRYSILQQIMHPLHDSEDVLKLPPAEMKKRSDAAKKKTINRYRKFLQDYLNEFSLKHHIADVMSNSIALRCDPHSSYFNLYEKESWDKLLSMEELSFGFDADENDKGEIIVSELAPGGAAWKSNQISVGDVILGFKFEGEPEVDLEFSETDDFYDQFYKSKGKAVELKLRKKDNQIKHVKIQKEKIHSSENVLNSYILSYRGTKAGYIPIPSFYSDAEQDSRQGVANDVAKEIIKLKQDSIQGLVIDLRYNGGGSMQEAMGLAGIFVDEGPLSIYKTRTDKPKLLKDLNRGSIWDGPLVVLVNGASASASEFVTATLQDYNRAVIVGSTTYGKGTAQQVIPVDTNLYYSRGKSYYINPNLGYVKITMGKFYRVTSKSHQGNGISPDVHIPDFSEKIYNKESAEQYFLPQDEVAKKAVYTALPALPVLQLRENSTTRIEGNNKFLRITTLGDSIFNADRKEQYLLLTVKDYKKYDDRLNHLTGLVEDALLLNEKDRKLTITNNAMNAQLGTFDDYQRSLNEKAIETLKSDIILNETFNIMSDLIRLLKP